MSDIMNSVSFVPEEKEYVNDLLNYLLDYNSKSDKYYNEIHIWSDGYCTTVDWVHKNYGYEDAQFMLVNEDQEVMNRVDLPDGTSEYVFQGDENETLETFLREHPNYYKNQWGRWVNKDEEVELSKLLNKEETEDDTNSLWDEFVTKNRNKYLKNIIDEGE